DRSQDPWDTSRGLRMETVPRVELDERSDYHDRNRVLIKPRFVGFCGSDRGIWFRKAFKDMICGSLDNESKAMRGEKNQRIIGHELFGEIVAVGSEARR